MAFSPDGVYLVFAALGTVYKRDEDTFTKLTDLYASLGLSVEFSPDGVYFAAGHNKSPYILIYKLGSNAVFKFQSFLLVGGL